MPTKEQCTWRITVVGEKRDGGTQYARRDRWEEQAARRAAGDKRELQSIMAQAERLSEQQLDPETEPTSSTGC